MPNDFISKKKMVQELLNQKEVQIFIQLKQETAFLSGANIFCYNNRLRTLSFFKIRVDIKHNALNSLADIVNWHSRRDTQKMLEFMT